jgi:hypothetical protein
MGKQSMSRPTTMGVGRAASRPRTQGADPARTRRNHLRTAVAAARRRETARDRAAQELVLDEPMTETGATRGNGTYLLVFLPLPTGLSVTSCQDDEGVIEKDGDPGTARQRVVAVEAPRQRAKPPFSRRSEGCRWRQAMWT